MKAPQKSYSEKLRDPRWQKKRTEILQRDGFACRLCLNNQDTLHVHHLRYVSGLEPWQSDDLDLTTVCESCHSKIEDVKRRVALLCNVSARIDIFRTVIEILEDENLSIKKMYEFSKLFASNPDICKHVFAKEKDNQ